MTTHEPITEQMLPALPAPALPAVPPDPDLVQRFLEPLKGVHDRAYAAGFRAMAERVAAAVERLERDCRRDAAAASRALGENDIASMSAYAERIATAGKAAEMVRRVLAGDL